MKKLVLVLAISMLVTIVREKTVENTENGKNLETTAGTSKDGENLSLT